MRNCASYAAQGTPYRMFAKKANLPEKFFWQVCL
jgi:hypothetical protein